MKTYVTCVALLGAALSTHAEQPLFYRIVYTSETSITSFDVNGLLGWSSTHTGGLACVQRSTTIAPFDWQDFTRVLVTQTSASVQVHDPRAPHGMSLVPQGWFRMGNATNRFLASEGRPDELPTRTVFVSRFYMDCTEVTKELWDNVKNHNGGNGYQYTNAGQGKSTNHPVQQVNWFDAVKWCNARSQMEGLRPVYYTNAELTVVYKQSEMAPYPDWNANGYRLPTEAEWEKAARGGLADRRFPWDDTDDISHAKANYYGRGDYSFDLSNGYHSDFDSGDFPFTSPVGSFKPNGYGLYDMAGNVAEWCWDIPSDYAVAATIDPRGDPPVGFFYRVIRGGHYVYYTGGPLDTRCSARYPAPPDIYPQDFIGFRCARAKQ